MSALESMPPQPNNTMCWLVAVGSDIAHRAKAGTASVYAIGRNPKHPELGEVLCGVKPDWWNVATVDLDAFPDETYTECLKCNPDAKPQGQQKLSLVA